MNLPNKLTILRVIMIPFFVFFMEYPYGGTPCEGTFKWIALALFILASLTDMADGKIARKYNLVTNFGKFADPIADKLLVCSALICLVALERIPAWAVIIIVAREFIINGIRLVASDNGKVIAASYWGKSKTVVQMIMVILMIVNFDNAFFAVLTAISMWLAIILTVVSMIDYVVKNRNVLKTN